MTSPMCTYTYNHCSCLDLSLCNSIAKICVHVPIAIFNGSQDTIYTRLLWCISLFCLFWSLAMDVFLYCNLTHRKKWSTHSIPVEGESFSPVLCRTDKTPFFQPKRTDQCNNVHESCPGWSTFRSVALISYFHCGHFGPLQQQQLFPFKVPAK